jgi:hypothetical protein
MTNVERFRRHWKNFSTLGRLRFASYYGIGWGILFAIVSELLLRFAFKNVHAFTLTSLATKAVVSAIIGFFYARVHWKVNEEKYQQLIQKDSKNQAKL